MHPETLRKKVRQAEADGGNRPELLRHARRGVRSVAARDLARTADRRQRRTKPSRAPLSIV
jgi:hypothetical protein